MCVSVMIGLVVDRGWASLLRLPDLWRATTWSVPFGQAPSALWAGAVSPPGRPDPARRSRGNSDGGPRQRPSGRARPRTVSPSKQLPSSNHWQRGPSVMRWPLPTALLPFWLKMWLRKREERSLPSAADDDSSSVTCQRHDGSEPAASEAAGETARGVRRWTSRASVGAGLRSR